jgi:hypothetical protein
VRLTFHAVVDIVDQVAAATNRKADRRKDSKEVERMKEEEGE